MDAQFFPAPMAPPQRPPSHRDGLHSARLIALSLASLDRRLSPAIRSSSTGRVAPATGPIVGMTEVARSTATVMARFLTSVRRHVQVASRVVGSTLPPLSAHTAWPAASTRATTAAPPRQLAWQPPPHPLRQRTPPCGPACVSAGSCAPARPLEFLVIHTPPSLLATWACVLAPAFWRTSHVAT